MTTRIPLIAGNWKMNLDHQQAIALVQKLAWSLKDAAHDYSAAEVAVFPPFTDLRTVQTLIDADKFEIRVGAQDISKFDSGAYTGEISGAFLKKLDVKFCLVGHSERRQYHHEDDATVQAKTAAAFKHGLIPVICVGETLEQLETEGEAAVPVRQTLAALSGHDSLGEFVIAYEPVWAIGTGVTATSQQAQEAHAFVRSLVADLYGQDTASRVRIQYGGSVKPNNAAELMACPDIDGALIGGAALEPQSFMEIIRNGLEN
mgnify:CR=1 FL=1